VVVSKGDPNIIRMLKSLYDEAMLRFLNGEVTFPPPEKRFICLSVYPLTHECVRNLCLKFADIPLSEILEPIQDKHPKTTMADYAYSTINRFFFGQLYHEGVKLLDEQEIHLCKIFEVKVNGEVYMVPVYAHVDEYWGKLGLLVDKKFSTKDAYKTYFPYSNHCKQVEYYRELLENGFIVSTGEASKRAVKMGYILHKNIANVLERPSIGEVDFRPRELIREEIIHKIVELIKYKLTGKLPIPVSGNEDDGICKYCDFRDSVCGKEWHDEQMEAVHELDEGLF
jgi:hypothetical protein